MTVSGMGGPAMTYRSEATLRAEIFKAWLDGFDQAIESFRSWAERLARRSGTHFRHAVRVPNRSAFDASRSALVTRSWHLKQ